MPDGGGTGDDGTVDVAIEPPCNPCYQYCACTPGDTVYSPTACMTYSCPGSGVWGKFNCLGHGCVDAAEEDASTEPSDATTADAADAGDATSVIDSPTTDGPADAPTETTIDAPAGG